MPMHNVAAGARKPNFWNHVDSSARLRPTTKATISQTSNPITHAVTSKPDDVMLRELASIRLIDSSELSVRAYETPSSGQETDQKSTLAAWMLLLEIPYAEALFEALNRFQTGTGTVPNTLGTSPSLPPNRPAVAVR